MPKPYDATVKLLLETYPEAWLDYAGVKFDGRVEVIDSDLSTITTQSDKVFRIADIAPWLAHVEIQASFDRWLALRILRYNILLQEKFRLPVHSILILLRPEADGPGLTGEVENRLSDGSCYHWFRYTLLRVWQRPVAEVLAGGLGTLPLAPISNVALPALPDVIRHMEERLRKETEQAKAAELWASTCVLMGLRFDAQFAEQLLKGVRDMEESTTYQAIKAKGIAEGEAKGEARGRIEEARRLLLKIGANRFGQPEPSVHAAIESENSVERLELLFDAVPQAVSWAELMRL